MRFDKEYYLKFGHHNDNIGFVIRHYDLLKNRNRVLVVPCGYGQIVNWCLSNSIDCTGYDISEFLMSILQPHLRNNVFQRDILELDEPLNKYNVVVCNDLLEHLDNDQITIALQNIKKNLAYNGVAIIRVGTSDMDCFDDDPTHITKQDTEWWIERCAGQGLVFCSGPTEIGEFIVEKNSQLSDKLDAYYKVKHKQTLNSDSVVELNAKWKLRNVRSLKFTDANGKQVTVFPREDKHIQICNDRQIFVTTTPVSEFEINFLDDRLLVMGDNKVLCHATIPLQYPLKAEHNATMVETFEPIDIQRQEITFKKVIDCEFKLRFKQPTNGDYLLICNENGDPYFYICIRESKLWYGLHFMPDTWISNPLAELENKAYNVRIQASCDRQYIIWLDDIKFELLPEYYALDTPKELSDEWKTGYIIYGADKRYPNNVPSDKFDITFGEVKGI